jgi:hypothetical protein
MSIQINQNNQDQANALIPEPRHNFNSVESSGNFVANEILSKQYTNDKGEIKGGNQVGYQVSFSDINILSNEMRKDLESNNPRFLYHWDAFETIANEIKDLTPTKIGKALNELLAEDFGKAPKNGGEKRLSNSQKNRYINGFYSGINRLKNLIEGKCKEIEDQEQLIPTGFIIKNNGESKRTYQRMRKVSEPRQRKSKPQKTKEQIKKELYAEVFEDIKAEVLEGLKHEGYNLVKVK